MKIAAIILNYNNWRDTLACLESVLASECSLAWVVVVDNASTDDSVARFRRWAAGEQAGEPLSQGIFPDNPKPCRFVEIADGSGRMPEIPLGSVILLHAGRNGGYAAGNNKGIRLLMAKGADAIWILNNDTVVDKKALGAMADRLYSKARPGLCGARIIYAGTDVLQCRAGGATNPWTGLSCLDGYKYGPSKALAEPPEAVEKRINFIYGACVLVSREFIETVGLMDECYFLYCEEQDWAYSAKGHFDFAYAPDAVVYHKEGATTGLSGARVSLRALLYLARSRILLTAKHFPWALPTVFLSIAFAAFRMAWRRCIARNVPVKLGIGNHATDIKVPGNPYLR